MEKLIKFCGLLGLFGIFAALATNIVGTILVDSHNPIADTISQLAITDMAWIQDLGLDLLAVGVIACAVGLYLNTKKPTKRFISSIILLVLVGIDIIVIAEHNKYAGRPDVMGASIHIYCVVILGLLLAAIMYLIQPHFEKYYSTLAKHNKYAFWGWVIGAPIFFLVPNNFDGLYERVLALIPLAWVSLVSWRLIKD